MSSSGWNSNPTNPPTDWWNPNIPEGLQKASSAFAAYTGLRAMQSSRIYSGLLFEATYEQKNMFASDIAASGVFPAMGYGMGAGMAEVDLLTYNAMQIGFDTLVSKLTQADAQVKFLTDGANWEMRQKALQLEKLTRGEFYRLHLYEQKQSIELDMLLHGRGYLKFYVDHDLKSPCIERVHPLDVFFDELEARDNPPQTMYQTRTVSKSSLAAQYPDFVDEIMRAQISADSNVTSSRSLNPAQMVEILECWHLPSAPNAGDGYHGLFIQTAQLSYEEYDRCDFPFATMTWCQRRRGPYPISAAEQVIFLQRNLNRLVQRQHECIYELSAPYIIKDMNDEVPPSHFQTGGVGNIIQGDFVGRPMPQVVAPKVVPDDIMTAIALLKQDIAAILGINGLESIGDKPQGLDSQPAMQSYTEQSSLRHVKTLKENERFMLRCAEQLLLTIREIKDNYGDYKAFGQGRKEVEKIKFTDADLPPDAYMAQMAPANMMPLTPAGRLNYIAQLGQTGAFTPKQMIRLMQSPDIDAATSDVTSTEEDIEWTIYEMCRPGGEYMPPDEHQDLTTGVERVNDAYLEQRRQHAPDAILERLDQWIAEASAMLQAQQQAMQQQMAMMQQGPQTRTQTTAPGTPAVGAQQAPTTPPLGQ